MDDKSAPLTHEAERAIRAYLLKLILPAGTALSVVSFIVGFLISHGAENQAAAEAFKTANDVMLRSVSTAVTAETDARRVSEELRNIQAEAERINEKLRTTEAFNSTTELVEKVADNLSTRKDFLDRVSGISTQLDSMRLRLDALESALRSAPHNPLPVSGGNTQSSQCPAGAYMVGARMQIDSGGPHGIISNVVPVCKVLLPN